MTSFVYYILSFAALLGVLIVVHEFGHYLAARLCGVKVLRFSVGFGRILCSKRFGRDKTEWAISAFPLGGYVKMLDEREAEVAPSEVHRAFNRQGVGKRSIIVAAGPFANFVLAIFLYWAMFIHGTDELLPVLGTPPAGTPAAMALIENGEQVKAVDGQSVITWNDLRWTLLKKSVDQEKVVLELVSERGELAIRQLYLAAAGENGWEGDALERLGIHFYRPEIPPVIGKIVSNGPADRAGLRAGDRVAVISGKPVTTWFEVVTAIRNSAERSVHIEFERGAIRSSVDVIPEAVSERGIKIGKIGVAVAEPSEPRRELKTLVRYDAMAAAGKALQETWDQSVFSFVMMGKMLAGEVSWKNLSGPVTIADYAGQSARLGFDYYFKFMALLSISLGVLNLLPIPVLDGGHLLYHMIEVVRRRPLSERAMEIGQQVGMSILFALMAFAFFNDLSRLFNG